MGAEMSKEILPLIAILLAGSASAQIEINASDYPIGTDISNAIPGVTMSYASIPFGIDPETISTLAAIPYTPSPLTIQSGTFGYGAFNTLGGDTGGLDGLGPGGLLLEFAHPIDAFSFVSEDFDGDPTFAGLFDSSGNTIVTGLTSETASDCVRNAGRCEYFNTGGAIQSSTPISAILIGGSDEEAFILSINATPVSAPEIDPTSAASGLTLLLGGLLVLRGRRTTPSPNENRL
jgi:hypothetical protein